jgi:hypothetical protein
MRAFLTSMAVLAMVVCQPLAGLAAEKQPLRFAALGQQQVMQSKRPDTRTAQICNICRNGFYYCFMGAAAPVGTPCWCAAWGSGWTSCF